MISKWISFFNRIHKVFYAANCALWLLEQEELKPFINSDWGDIAAIRDLLKNAGCKPSCDMDDVLDSELEDFKNELNILEEKIKDLKNFSGIIQELNIPDCFSLLESKKIIIQQYREKEKLIDLLCKINNFILKQGDNEIDNEN